MITHLEFQTYVNINILTTAVAAARKTWESRFLFFLFIFYTKLRSGLYFDIDA